MIDKKTIKKSLIIILLIAIIIFAIVQLRKTLARYETTTKTNSDLEVAFWMIEEGYKTDRLLINNIYPDNDNTFEYDFTVSNFRQEKDEDGNVTKVYRAETSLNYELTLIATTNIPLEYSISKNGKSCSNITQTIITDSDGTCYRKITAIISDDANDKNTFSVGTDETDEFTITVRFPEISTVNGTQVDNRTDLDYPDLIENVKIELSATQIIEGE